MTARISTVWLAFEARIDNLENEVSAAFRYEIAGFFLCPAEAELWLLAAGPPVTPADCWAVSWISRDASLPRRKVQAIRRIDD